jgi:phosphoglycerate dehydrogenase-like enzyme
MALNVLVTMPFSEDLLEQIRSAASEINLSYAPLKGDEPLPKSTVAVAEVLYTLSALPRPEEAPNLRWVQFHSAGIDHVQGHPLLDCDLLVTSTSGIHVVPIGEYVLASILAWSHRVPRMLVYQKRGIWPSGRWEKFVPQELRGATIGIVGYGSIGREVARLAHAFAMRILATKRDPRQVEDTGYRIAGTGDPHGELPTRIYPSAAMRSMLPECDFVVLSAPLTEETHHLIDRAALKAMKDSAYLVNIGRGELIDQPALIDALQKGWIAGAGLDVFEIEPLPADSPLWKLDNVILSPHVAGFTPEYDRRAAELFAANLRRYTDNQPLINVIDCQRGY